MIQKNVGQALLLSNIVDLIVHGVLNYLNLSIANCLPGQLHVSG